jgi:hypothetical protein
MPVIESFAIAALFIVLDRFLNRFTDLERHTNDFGHRTVPHLHHVYRYRRLRGDTASNLNRALYFYMHSVAHYRILATAFPSDLAHLTNYRRRFSAALQMTPIAHCIIRFNRSRNQRAMARDMAYLLSFNDRFVGEISGYVYPDNHEVSPAARRLMVNIVNHGNFYHECLLSRFSDEEEEMNFLWSLVGAFLEIHNDDDEVEFNNDLMDAMVMILWVCNVVITINRRHLAQTWNTIPHISLIMILLQILMEDNTVMRGMVVGVSASQNGRITYDICYDPVRYAGLRSRVMAAFDLYH